MSWWKKKDHFDKEIKQNEADSMLRKSLNALSENRKEHHKVMATTAGEIIGAYIVLAEKRGKK